MDWVITVSVKEKGRCVVSLSVIAELIVWLEDCPLPIGATIYQNYMQALKSLNRLEPRLQNYITDTPVLVKVYSYTLTNRYYLADN